MESRMPQPDSGDVESAMSSARHLPPDLNGYTFLQHVRSATTHDTYLARRVEDGELVVVRVHALELLRQDADRRRAVERTVLLGRTVRHGHLAESLPPFATKSDIFLVERFYGGGELFEAMVSFNKSMAATAGGADFYGLPLSIARRIARELVAAVRYLHDAHGLCHRNIKLENVLLDAENRVRLSGLGMAAVLPARATAAAAAAGSAPASSASSSSCAAGSSAGDRGDDGEGKLVLCCGSKHYAAPEVVRGEPYDGRAVDAWAVGVVVFAVLTGTFPFDSSISNAVIFKKIRNAERVLEEHTAFKALTDEHAKAFLRSIFRIRPSQRLTLQQMQEHPFLSVDA